MCLSVFGFRIEVWYIFYECALVIVCVSGTYISLYGVCLSVCGFNPQEQNTFQLKGIFYSNFPPPNLRHKGKTDHNRIRLQGWVTTTKKQVRTWLEHEIRMTWNLFHDGLITDSFVTTLLWLTALDRGYKKIKKFRHVPEQKVKSTKAACPKSGARQRLFGKGIIKFGHRGPNPLHLYLLSSLV